MVAFDVVVAGSQPISSHDLERFFGSMWGGIRRFLEVIARIYILYY